MAEKHRAEGTDSLSQAATPQPTPEPPASPEDAVAMLQQGLGPMDWTRTYRQVEGGYVDTETGEFYDSIPKGDPYTGPAN